MAQGRIKASDYFLKRMEDLTRFIIIIVGLVLAVAASAASGQQIFSQQFTTHNSQMGKLQPSWIVPLVTTDPRLIQYARFSVSHEYTAARAETVSYGNGRGLGVTLGNRFELDYVPPAYIQHNMAGAIDGFGDTTLTGRFRIASGNAQHGNFDVGVALSHCFATGSYKNGASTDSFGPTLSAGITRRNFALISSLGGTLPTGKIAAQGRTIAWNTAGQFHASPHVWIELENNSTFYVGGPRADKMQNFVTPAAFYVVRRKEWKPAHPFWIFDAGMQVATSGFHTYNHNLVAETRILF